MNNFTKFKARTSRIGIIQLSSCTSPFSLNRFRVSSIKTSRGGCGCMSTRYYAFSASGDSGYLYMYCSKGLGMFCS